MRQNGPTSIWSNLLSFPCNAVHILYSSWFEQKAKIPHFCPEATLGKWICKRSSELFSRPVKPLVARRLGTLRITLHLMAEKRPRKKAWSSPPRGSVFYPAVFLQELVSLICVWSDLVSLNFSPAGSRERPRPKVKPTAVNHIPHW